MIRLFVMQRLLQEPTIPMLCKLNIKTSKIKLNLNFFSDACVVSTCGDDKKKIRDGIEELDFKP